MTLVLAALTAVQLLVAAPLEGVGHTRRDAMHRFGEPVGIGTDTVGTPGERGAGHVVTLDYAKTRVRLYEPADGAPSRLIYVATVDDRFPTRGGVRVGSDRDAVLSELGAPAYEDEDQIIYAVPRADDPATSDRVRIVLENDRVAGIEWTFPR